MVCREPRRAAYLDACLAELDGAEARQCPRLRRRPRHDVGRFRGQRRGERAGDRGSRPVGRRAHPDGDAADARSRRPATPISASCCSAPRWRRRRCRSAGRDLRQRLHAGPGGARCRRCGSGLRRHQAGRTRRPRRQSAPRCPRAAAGHAARRPWRAAPDRDRIAGAVCSRFRRHLRARPAASGRRPAALARCEWAASVDLSGLSRPRSRQPCSAQVRPGDRRSRHARGARNLDTLLCTRTADPRVMAVRSSDIR